MLNILVFAYCHALFSHSSACCVHLAPSDPVPTRCYRPFNYYQRGAVDFKRPSVTCSSQRQPIHSNRTPAGGSAKFYYVPGEKTQRFQKIAQLPTKLAATDYGTHVPDLIVLIDC
ncbi:hypothetical protein FGIG_11971 [Fasciola gigantica]|uniref:Secreted protein n=1 Tax=Fasciola gigantica TaxID=46835 RepID=A0A504Y1E1_FASGI|nr:hypothetical protein FGIG_11971 [Fasciola gigantica]